jgi:hypothetical protein
VRRLTSIRWCHGASETEAVVYREDATTPWSVKNWPGLAYAPGAERIVVALVDPCNWRGRICLVTSERRPERRPSRGSRP